jgi:hypothetical protein
VNVGRNDMMQILRIIVVSAIAGWLCWWLGKTVIDGIRTGKIHHTDSTKVCCRNRNPAGFWALVALFTGFVAMFAWAWGFSVIDAVRKMN